MTATTYHATATREGSWWVLDVDGVGVTQCARLTEARAQIRGLIEAVEDRDVPEETHVEVRLEGPVDVALAEAREIAAAAESLRDVAASKLRKVAHQLVDAGLKQAEAAVVLEVSKQRMTQLLADDVRAEQAPEGTWACTVGDVVISAPTQAAAQRIAALVAKNGGVLRKDDHALCS